MRARGSAARIAATGGAARERLRGAHRGRPRRLRRASGRARPPEASEATLSVPRRARQTMKGPARVPRRGARGARGPGGRPAHAPTRPSRSHAIGAAYGLASPHDVPRAERGPRGVARCRTAPSRAPRLAALRRAVAEAEAHRMTGKYDEALAHGDASARRGARDPAPSVRGGAAAAHRGVQARDWRTTRSRAAAFEEAFAACEAAAQRLARGHGRGDGLPRARRQPRGRAARPSDGSPSPRGSARARGATIAPTPRSSKRSSPSSRAKGHADRSLALRGRLIELLQRIYGTSHPRLAAAMANQASDLVKTGQYDLSVRRVPAGDRDAGAASSVRTSRC